MSFIIIFAILLFCKVGWIENYKKIITCNFICGCEEELAVKLKNFTERRGLFDPFPKDRIANTSYLHTRAGIIANPPTEVVFIVVSIAVSALIQHVITYQKIRLPYQAFVLLLSSVAGIISKLYPSFDRYTLVTTINPMLIILLFLPSIIIHTVFSIDFYIMRKCIGQIVVLGIIGFILRSILIGVIMVLFMKQEFLDSWGTFFIFGATCSITQPQEALRILKTVGEFKHISALLEAESLVSISLGIFVYNVTIFAVGEADALLLAKYTFNGSIGSIMLGLAFGWVTYFLLKMVSTEATVFTYILIMGSYLLYYITQVIICFSGITAILAYLWVLHRIKTALSPTDEKFFEHIIQCFGFISNTMIYSMAGIVVTENLLVEFKTYKTLEIVGAFVTYFVTYFVRFTVLFTLLPLIRKTGYYMKGQSMAIIVISGIRGSFALCLALASSLDVNLKMYTTKFLLCVSILVLLSGIINPLCLSLAIRMFGIDRVDEAKVNNMTAIIKDIIKGRKRTLNFLKSDKEYSEANWGLVESFTIIRHPYHWAKTEDIEERWQGRRSSAICPQCKKDQAKMRSAADLIAEANQRILQIKKINYRRQYDERLLNINELRSLEAIIDQASDTKNKVLLFQSIRDLWAESWFSVKFRQTLCGIIFLGKVDYIQPPFNRFRLRAYRIILFKYYGAIIYCLNLLSLVPLYYDFFYKSQEAFTTKERYRLDILLNIAYIAFFVIFCVDFVLKITAMGWWKYFRSIWNVLELLLLLCSTFDFIIEFIILCYNNFQEPFTLTEVNMWLKLVRALYLLRIIQLIQSNMIRLLALVDQHIQIDKISGYNVGLCVIKTQDEIIKYTQYMSENERPSFEFEYREIAQQYEVMKDLGTIQNDFPLVSVTVKTKHAIQVILNSMQAHISALKDKGIIDDMEIKIFKDIFKQKNMELNKIVLVPSSIPEAIFKNTLWLAEDSSIEYLMDSVELISFEAGDEILSVGERPKGLFMLLSGSATSNYVYSNIAEYNQKCYGMLPNCDFLVRLNFDENQQNKDVVCSGFVFGEIGVLTDRPYNYTVTCDTACTVFYISKEIMHRAFELSKDLKFRMWKAVAIKIVSLQIQLQFQKLLADTLKFKLQSGYLFILDNCQSLQWYNTPEYLFLLEGIMEDENNEKYIAPTSIPDTIKSLTICNLKNEELIKKLGLPNDFDKLNEETVEIKVLMVVTGDEGIIYTLESDNLGNYSILEDEINLFCENHKTRRSIERQRLFHGSFTLDEYEGTNRQRSSFLERLKKSFNTTNRGSNTE